MTNRVTTASTVAPAGFNEVQNTDPFVNAFLDENSPLDWTVLFETVKTFLQHFPTDQDQFILDLIKNLEAGSGQTASFSLVKSIDETACAIIHKKTDKTIVYFLEPRQTQDEKKDRIRTYEKLENGKICIAKSGITSLDILDKVRQSLEKTSSLEDMGKALKDFPYESTYIRQPKSTSQCKWKLFTSVLKTLFSDPKKYERWKWYFKKFVSERAEKNKTYYEFLEILKISTAKLLGKNFLQIKEVPHLLSTPADLPTETHQESDEKRIPNPNVSQLKPLGLTEQQVIPPSESEPFAYIVLDQDIKTAEQIETSLEAIDGILEKAEPSFLSHILEIFAERISLEPSVWQGLSDKEAALDRLQKIGQHYAFYQIIKVERPIMEWRGVNTMMTLCWLSLIIGKLLSPELKDYAVDITLYASLLTRTPLGTWSKKEIERWHNLLSLFKEQNEQKKPEQTLFSFQTDNQNCSSLPLALMKAETSYIDIERKTKTQILEIEIVRKILKADSKEMPVFRTLLTLFYLGQIFCGRSKFQQESTWENPSENLFTPLKGGRLNIKLLPFPAVQGHANYPFYSMFGPKGSTSLLSIGNHPFYGRGPCQNGSRLPENYYLIGNPGHLPLTPATTQNDLTIQAIILWCSNNMRELGKPETQAFTEFMLGAVFENQSPKLPFFPLKEELDNEMFVSQITQFINEGLKSFYYQFNDNHPDVFTSLFFIRLSMRIQNIHPDCDILRSCMADCKKVLDSLLEDNRLTDEEKQAACLHRAYFHTLEKNHEPLIADWILAQLLPSHKDWEEPCLVKEIQSYLSQLNLSTCPETALHTVIKDLKSINNLENTVWTGSFPVYERGPFKINCYTGQVSKNGEDVTYKGVKATLKERTQRIDGFDSLFPEADIASIYRQGESLYFFSLNQQKKIRICKGLVQKITSQNSKEIVECTYIPNTRVPYDIPFYLRAEPFSCWQFPSGVLSFEDSTQSEHYTWSVEKGIIDEKKKRKILTLSEGSEIINYIGIKTHNIKITIKSDTEVESVEFPSIKHPQSQQVFSLEQKGGYFYLVNENYRLICTAKTSSQDFQTLTFVSDTSHKQVKLLPFCWNNNKVQRVGETSFCFLEYTVSGDDLTAKIPLEGTLALALEAFQQKKYSACLKYLSRISSTRKRLSPVALHILTKILSEENPNPEASCCVLKSALFLVPVYQQRTIYDNQEDNKKIEDAVLTAYETFNNKPNRAGAIHFQPTPFEWNLLRETFKLPAYQRSPQLVTTFIKSTSQETSSLEKSPLTDVSVEFKDYFAKALQQSTLPDCPIKSLNVSPDVEQATRAQLKAWQESYKQGADFEKNQIHYTCSDIPSLKSKLEEKTSSLKSQLERSKTALLTLANQLSSVEIEKLKQLLLRSNALPNLEVEECVHLFTQDNFDVLIGQRNPTLDSNAKKVLKEAILTFLIEAIQLRKVEDAKKAFEDGNIQFGAEKLFAKSVIRSDENINRYLRALEYFLGFQIREDQAAIIEEVLKQKAGIYQLMMGGGKTSVIITLLMMLLSNPQSTPILTAPQAQMPTLYENLSSVMHRFGRKLYFIEIEAHLNDKELNLIYNTLLQAQASRGAIIITNRDLQLLSLEFIKLCDQIKENSDLSLIQKRWTLLKNILLFISKNGKLISDEVHLALTPNVQTIIPIDKESSLDVKCVTILKHIFLALDKQGVSFNNPDLFSPEQFATTTLEKVAQEIYTQLIKEEISWNSFKNYILSNKVPQGNFQKETIQKVQFITTVLKSLIPHVLTQSYNRTFGRSQGKMSVRAIPYSGVDSPSPTKFADPIVEALYVFLIFKNSETTSKDVEILKSKFLESALTELISSTEIQGIDATFIGSLFKQLTNTLLSSNDPKDLNKASDYINASSDRKIAFAEQIVLLTVRQNKEILKSTSIDLIQMFTQEQTGLSGTVASCFAPPMSDKIKADSQGVDGRVALKLVRSNPRVLTVKENLCPLDQIEESLKTASCLIDVGGFLRQSSNEDMARKIAKITGKRVLFYGREKPEDSFPDCLMLLDTPTSNPIIIRSTQKQDLLPYLSMPYFVLFDERHCEATDIPLPANSCGILNLSSDTDWDTFIQALLRQRQFLEGQTVTIVTKNENLKNITDVIRETLACGFSQNPQKKLMTAGSLIEAAVKKQSLAELLSLKNPAEVPSHFKREIFVTPQHSLWDNSTLSIPYSRTTAHYMKDYAETWGKKSPSSQESVKNVLKTIENHLSELPSHVQTSSSLSNQLNAQMELAAQRETETETELETELKTQRQIMRTLPSKREVYQETSWTPAQVHSLSNLTLGKKEETPGTTIFPVSDLFDSQVPGHDSLYAPLFSSLLTTRNFARTILEGYHSVFCNLQKDVQFLLFVQNGSQLHAICLSLRETHFFKNFIEDKKPDNMWLKVVDGSYAAPYKNPMPDDLKAASEDILFKANLFQGNIRYLLKSQCAKHLKGIDEIACLSYLRLKLTESNLPLILQLRHKIRAQNEITAVTPTQLAAPTAVEPPSTSSIASTLPISLTQPPRSPEEPTQPPSPPKDPPEKGYIRIVKGVLGLSCRFIFGCLGMAFWAPAWYNYFYEMSQKLYRSNNSR